MADFKREDQTMYSIPQRFAEQHFKRCPFCRMEEPGWLVKEEWKLMGKNYYFKCPNCNSILKVAQDDVTGLSFTTASFSGKRKKSKGKDNRQIYVTVEKIDLRVKTQQNALLEGAEFSLDELKDHTDRSYIEAEEKQ